MRSTASNDTTPRSDALFGPEAGPAAERIAFLAEFMTSERYGVLRGSVAMRMRYMTVLAENMYHGQNAAALIRHCDAFGVQHLHTVETRCAFRPNPVIARGSERWVDVERHASTAEAIASLRREGYRIVATTPHREDVTPETFDVARGPFALIFGTAHRKRHPARRRGYRPPGCSQHDPRPARSTGTPCAPRSTDRIVTILQEKGI